MGQKVENDSKKKEWKNRWKEEENEHAANGMGREKQCVSSWMGREYHFETVAFNVKWMS